MKKKLIVIITLCLMMSLSLSTKAKANSKFNGQTLTIYNVEDYISQGQDGYVDLISNFEQEYGVKVNYYTYDTNETMYNQFTLQKEGTYDLICTSDYMIQKMIIQELVQPIDLNRIPNYQKYAATTLRNKLKEMKVPYQGSTVNLDQFAVGYMWGTLGLIYDPECSDTITEDIKSWDVLYDPKYENLISIKNSMRDAYVIGLMHHYSKDPEYKIALAKYLSPDATIEDKQEFNKLVQNIFDFELTGLPTDEEHNLEKIAYVKEELINLKKNIFGFEVDSGKNDIITGKIKINLAYSGDAVYSIDTAREEADKRLEYFVPEDGSNIWYDAWTMPKGSKNQDLAYEFLNYLSDPQNAADNMDYIGYTPYIVGDQLFTLTSSWYGASDFATNCSYYAENESMVIYNDQLYLCINDLEANQLDDQGNPILPTNEEYFELCEYDKTKTYYEGDMVSYNGKIYNCISTNEEGTSNSITNEEEFEEVEGYDLTFLFGGSFEDENRRAIIYPYLGSLNQLETQYPSEHVIARCAIMNDFGEYNEKVVIMWGQVKAYINMTPVYIFFAVFLVIVISISIVFIVRHHLDKKYKRSLKNN